MTEPAHRGLIPALDGVRGIAILLVLIHHFTLYRPTRGIDHWIAAVPVGGWMGVDVFFVLSGFLITGILLDSRDSPHYFKSFYARRSLRIFPLYYLVLFLALIVLPHFATLHTVIVGPYENPPAWPYWTYLTNFSVADRDLVHGWLDLAWSLAIEEQFYIVWAVVMFVCPVRWVGPLCAAILIGEPIARAIAIANGVPALSIYMLTWFRLDGLAMGALLAWLLRRGWLEKLSAGVTPAVAAGLAALVAITVASGDAWWMTPLMQRYGFSVVAFTAAAMVIAAVHKPADSLWTRALSAGWLRAFGKYSYCLYLTHLPVMRLMRAYVFDPFDYEALAIAPWIGQVLFYLVATIPSFALAWVSWRVFEAPILRLKAKFPY